MSIEATSDPIRQKALAGLVANLTDQGHPPQYAQVIAASIIFQADLDLRNAQVSSLLGWLEQEHNHIYKPALDLLAKTREDFERRVQQG